MTTTETSVQYALTAVSLIRALDQKDKTNVLTCLDMVDEMPESRFELIQALMGISTKACVEAAYEAETSPMVVLLNTMSPIAQQFSESGFKRATIICDHAYGSWLRVLSGASTITVDEGIFDDQALQIVGNLARLVIMKHYDLEDFLESFATTIRWELV